MIDFNNLPAKDKIYYNDGQGHVIYSGDVLSVLTDMPDECVDLIITSPPFNLGNTHHTGNHHHYPYDDDIPEPTYQSWQITILNELYRITKSTGSLWYQHKNRIRNGVSITPYSWLLQSKWLIKQEVVWRNRSQNFDKIRFYPMTERLYWLAKSPDTKLFNAVNMHDDWHIEPTGTSREHTRAFPIELVSNIVACFADAKVILDPFVGSGTVLEVAKLNNRMAIGIDISEDYCAIAAARLIGATIV